jgi:hypothetical protein
MKHIKQLIYIFSVASVLVLFSCTDTLMGDEGKLDESIYFNYITKTDLELPFEEEWHIEVGGRTHRENFHHFISRGERYASDIVIEIDGRIRTGDGSRNENHYCFGKRLNAPSNGKIIEMVNNVDDNQPGNINRDQPGGNYIIIDHLNGESSIMAHLKKGSIIVAVGDTVIKGQEIGKAGNSGASTAPHLHYELRGTSGRINGLGLPAQFLNYYEDNVFVERGELVNSQKVRKN